MTKSRITALDAGPAAYPGAVCEFTGKDLRVSERLLILVRGRLMAWSEQASRAAAMTWPAS